MGKNISEFNDSLSSTIVGGTAWLQKDQPETIRVAGRVFCQGSKAISKEVGDFDDNIIEYIENNAQDLNNTRYFLSTEVSDSYRTVYEVAPKAKAFHWSDEIVLGDYTYIPLGSSVDVGNGNNRYLS